MAYKQRGFPMHAGISPMRQGNDDIAAKQEAERVRLETERLKKISTEEAEKEAKREANITTMEGGTGNTLGTKTLDNAKNIDTKSKTDVTDETKKQALRDAWRNTGGGHIYAAGESIVKGIKNIRAKRKARKAGELTDAQAAVTGGTANLKQTKLVDKTNNRTHEKLVKTEKANIKDAEKLKQYNIDKKNKAAGISKRQAEKNKATQDAASGELYKVGK
jgi:hypothetical protein